MIKETNLLQIDVFIFIYDDSIIPDDVLTDSFSRSVFENINHSFHCEVIREKGVIGQFIYKYFGGDKKWNNYDYYCITLDDVKLSSNYNLGEMIQLLEAGRFDILSPTMHKDSVQTSHKKFMSVDLKKYPSHILESNFVELFHYVMTKKAFIKYYNLLDDKSAWLWYIDFIMHPQGFKMGIVTYMDFRHYYTSGGDRKPEQPDKFAELHHNEKRFKESICGSNGPNYKIVSVYEVK